MMRFGFRTGMVRLFAPFILTTAVFFAAGTTAAMAQPDILIKDCSADNGIIPSLPGNCGTVYWSPDIWGRLAPDGSTVDQGPVLAQPYYVYIRLKNIGDKPLGCGVVHLYFRDASVGGTSWPSDWIARWNGTSLTADEIGSVCVCCILPGQTEVVMIPWASVPPNYGGGVHHCLLARFVSAEDPMTSPGETSNTYDNIRYNSNVAQKNLASLYIGNSNAHISLFNRKADAVRTTLKFDAVQNENGNNVFDVAGFQVKVVLGADLYARWNGAGVNVEPHPEDNSVVITNPHAELDDFDLAGYDYKEPLDYNFEVQMQYPANIPASETKTVYSWTMELWPENAEAPENGEAFEIHMAEQPKNEPIRNDANLDGAGKTVKRPDPVQGTKLELTAQPNISAANTTIGFTLPKASQVTLAIYDAKGTLVRTLIADASQAAGTHEINWDGRTAGGAQVAVGTYFYRLITPDASVERQIKIVR